MTGAAGRDCCEASCAAGLVGCCAAVIAGTSANRARLKNRKDRKPSALFIAVLLEGLGAQSSINRELQRRHFVPPSVRPPCPAPPAGPDSCRVSHQSRI